MIIWAKKFVKDGNKLIQRNFKSNLKNSLPFSLTQINKQIGEWSIFYEIVLEKKYNQILKTENHFCSRNCSATFNNHKRGPMSEETKRKISQRIKIIINI